MRRRREQALSEGWDDAEPVGAVSDEDDDFDLDLDAEADDRADDDEAEG